MTGLKISILQGTTSDRKTEYYFDHRHQMVVVGCDAESCDISFPERYRDTGMGNEHIAFRRSLGRYQVDLNMDNHVLIDGETPFEDQEIAGTATVQLGEDVIIEVEVIDERRQPKNNTGRNLQAGEQVQRTNRHLRTLLVFLVLLGAAMLYIGEHQFWLESDIHVSDDNVQRVAARLDAISATLTQVKGQADGIPREVIEGISRSVYLILVRNSGGGEQPAGTAWVIEGNRLVTNAHVAGQLERLKPQEEMIARSPVAPYRSYVIKDAFIHPGYAAFGDLWSGYWPCQKVGDKLSLFKTTTPADVAILYPENPEDLGRPLPLATMEELSAIGPGMPVAFVGYPMEALLPGNNKKPAPVAQQDEIIRVTDFFQTRRDDFPNRLIHHGLPVTGGASGSPMFTAEGKVIGIISSMNVSPGTWARTPNAADVNFGQRIDFLFDLLGPDPDGRVAALKQQWKESLREYLPGYTTSNQEVLDAAKDIFGVDTVKSAWSISSDVLMKNSQGAGAGAEKIHLERPGLYLIRIQSEDTIQGMKIVLSGKKNISAYTPKIDFANYAHYAFVLAGEPGNIGLTYTTSPKGDGQPARSRIDIAYWDAALGNAADALITYVLKKQSPDMNVSVIKKIDKLALDEERNGVFYSGFDIDLEETGHYLFMSVPQQDGELDVAVMNMNNDLLVKDETKNGIGIAIMDNKKAQKVNFIAFSRNKGVVQGMTVYFFTPQQ
ncbi:hypothetical protein DND132_2365 [Pseudodesulfovibrio mercurii]|uniref:Trypsin-like peptidase domain-containing protein n=1 Tax=Pseudodesulfovibrio mercurii TaxID=641491 RepID=F0JBR6_9BACT|nr:serine protease [Pseudodesulfovibrio mercurii]EGB15569.1 hypothetical protein DND132_2365 [Pseudodesulfovibrio mercurii]